MRKNNKEFSRDDKVKKSPNRLVVGAIEWFDNYKGFGLLQTLFNGSVFIHIQSFAKKPIDKLRKHQLVAFRLKDWKGRPEKFRAVGSFLLETPAHFKILMSLLNQNSTLVLGEDKICFLQKGTLQIFETRPIQSFMDTVMNYYDSNLNDIFFVDFCEYLEKIAIPNLNRPNPELLEQQLYCYFYRNLRPSILFQAWKSSAFRYIGYTEGMDYEIPAEIIKEYSHQMDMLDWKRIQDYSYANSFFKK